MYPFIPPFYRVLFTPYYPYYYPPESYQRIPLTDYGKQPFIIDIDDAAEENDAFRLSLWTGDHLQLTLMHLNVGEDIGLERHPNTDQFIRIVDGEGLALMGPAENNLNMQRRVEEDDVILIPAGTWHNVVNIGDEPLKLYSIYAPPEHPYKTVQSTKVDAT